MKHPLHVNRRSILGAAAGSLCTLAFTEDARAQTGQRQSQDTTRRVGNSFVVGDGRILLMQQDSAFLNRPANGGMSSERREFELPEGTEAFGAWLIGWSAYFHDSGGAKVETPISQMHIKLATEMGDGRGVATASAWWSDADETNDDFSWTAEVSFMVICVG